MKTEKELIEQFREELYKESFKKEERTVEEALEEALELTTPEEPGDPRDNKKAKVRQEDDEWL